MPRVRQLSIVLAVAATCAAAAALAFARPLTAAPTRTQRAGILRAFGDPSAANGCLIVKLAASNHRFATVRFRRTHNCSRWAFNGINVLRRAKPHHWRIAFEGSAFSCPLPRIPRQVQLDLRICP